jgi:serine/threonine-protein kinase
MYTRINDVFSAALEVPEDEREQFLNEECQQDQELRAAVERLLHTGLNPDTFIATGGGRQGPLWEEICSDLTADLSPAKGERVGPYRLLGEVGRGGMGVVYLGERADGEFDKKVALKLLQLGVDTKEVVRRFRQERQILASLDHPGIVRLLDGGVTKGGRPYYAMEYVEGKPIDRYCDESCLTIDERLEYFMAVAEVVQHAHQNLVIHRDLKPSNILVNERGEVRLLDFGIAKLLDDEADRQTAPTTRTDVRVMTPEYASPEQVQGGAISVASDVYQLGLLLYELLTGRRPYRLNGSSVKEMEQAICESDPTLPSMVVAGQDGEVAPGCSAEEAARARRSNPERLCWKLRGDLDTIVLKAIRKEPGRRYATVEHLLQDLRRYLSGRPVKARKDTFRYRLGKLAQRHHVGLCSSLGVLLLISGLVAFHMMSLARERDRARLEAEKATQVSDFLETLFKVSDPSQAKGEDISARELVDRGARRITSELAGQPEVQAEMMVVLGNVYQNLGLYRQAEPLLADALAIRRRLDSEDATGVVASMNALGVLYMEEGRYSEAEPMILDAIAIAEESFGADHPKAAACYLILGNIYVRQGKIEEAGQLYRQALEIRERELGPAHSEVAACINNLAGVLFNQGKYSEAEPLFRRSLAVRTQTLGADHPSVAEASSNLAATVCVMGRPQEAEPLYHRAMEIWVKAFGPDHPRVANVHNNLGALYGRLGRLADAESHFLRSLEIRRTALGDSHPQVARCLANVAITQSMRGRSLEAETSFQQALDLLKATVDPDHPMAIWIMGEFGTSSRNYGSFNRAESLLLHVCESLEKTPDNPMLGGCLVQLGLLRAEQGADASALPLLERAMTLLEEGYQPEHDKVLAACNGLARIYIRMGRHEDGEALYRRVLTTLASKRGSGGIGPAHELLEATAHVGLGDLQQHSGDMAAARTSWNRALAVLGPPDHESRVAERYHINATALLRLDRTDEAQPLIEWLRGTGWRNRDLIEQCSLHDIAYVEDEAVSSHYRLAYLNK